MKIYQHFGFNTNQNRNIWIDFNIREMYLNYLIRSFNWNIFMAYCIVEEADEVEESTDSELVEEWDSSIKVDTGVHGLVIKNQVPHYRSSPVWDNFSTMVLRFLVFIGLFSRSGQTLLLVSFLHWGQLADDDWGPWPLLLWRHVCAAQNWFASSSKNLKTIFVLNLKCW